MDTISSTPETLDVLTKRITDLESALATEIQKNADLERSKETREGVLSKALENNRLNEAKIDNFIENLAKYAENFDIDFEIAADLAECFGRELTRKVVGHIRIEGDVEIEVPVGFDLDTIGDELDIHIGQAYTSVVRIEYSDVSLVEIEEN